MFNLDSIRSEIRAGLDGPTQTPAARRQIAARGEQILSELERLEHFDALTTAQQSRWDELMGEARELTRTLGLGRMTGRYDGSRIVTNVGPGVRMEAVVPDRGRPDDDPGGDPFNPRAGQRDQALRFLDAEVRSGRLADFAAERVEKLVSHGSPQSRSFASRWTLATGSEAYRSAFAKLALDADKGHLLWSAEEADAFRAAQTLNLEQRAMSLTDTAGGFLVPMHLDPSINLTSAGSSDPLRQVARIEQIATDVWNGVTSAGATSEWKAEAAEAADNSPTLAQPSIPVHMGSSFVPYSVELGMDSADALIENLSAVLLDAAAELQAAAYWRGTGTGQPKGLITALLAAGGVTIATAAADTLALGDVTKPQNALGPRFQPRAAWFANLTVINSIGSFESAAGARRFPEVSEGRLLNRPLYEASSLDNPGATAAAGNDEVLLYGDPKQFVIVDRIGTTIEFIPHLFGANGRPKGQRGAWMNFRSGSDVIVPGAFRILQA